ncbi:MAG: hypothetical protein JW753_01995 [Dehalococcoidia bacterium]|nr:hypothetical protein [Dehalococcoidia bacterium]
MTDSEPVAVSATVVVAPVLAVAAALSGVTDVWSVVGVFAGLGFGLVDFEGLPSINAQNEPNHECLEGFTFFVGGAAKAPDSGPRAVAKVPDGPRVCSVV